MASVVLASALVFTVRHATLALVEPPLVAFQPIAHVELAAIHVSETDHSDWLFILANHYTIGKQE